MRFLDGDSIHRIFCQEGQLNEEINKLKNSISILFEKTIETLTKSPSWQGKTKEEGQLKSSNTLHNLLTIFHNIS